MRRRARALQRCQSRCRAVADRRASSARHTRCARLDRHTFVQLLSVFAVVLLGCVRSACVRAADVALVFVPCVDAVVWCAPDRVVWFGILADAPKNDERQRTMRAVRRVRTCGCVAVVLLLISMRCACVMCGRWFAQQPSFRFFTSACAGVTTPLSVRRVVVGRQQAGVRCSPADCLSTPQLLRRRRRLLLQRRRRAPRATTRRARRTRRRRRVRRRWRTRRPPAVRPRR